MGIAERREREKEQRRNSILDAAEYLFFTRGLDQTTMEEVAEKAELSKGTLYLYFKSKEDIRFAIFRRGADILIDKMKSSISESKNGLENLLLLGRIFIEFSVNHADYFSLFIDIQSSKMHLLDIDQKTLEDYIKYQSPMTVVQQCVNQGIADQSLRNDMDPDTLSSVLWSQILGVLMVINNHEYLFDLLEIRKEEILRTHLEIAKKGITSD